MIFTALKISVNGDVLASRHKKQEKSGVLVFVNGGSQDEVDDLASKLSLATQENVYILEKKAFGAKRHLPKSEVEERGYAVSGWRRWSSTQTVNESSYYLVDANDHDRIHMDLGTSWGLKMLQYDSLLHVGNPVSPMLLYGNIRGVAKGPDVFEFSKLTDLVQFLGSCEDPLSAMAMCNGCSQKVCYSTNTEGLQEKAFKVLEKDKRYLSPSRLDSLFTGKRIGADGIKNGLSWDNAADLHSTRATAAKIGAAVRNFKKKNCSRCYASVGKLTCSKLRECTKIYSEKDVKDLLKTYCKKAGMPLRANSYLGQANLRLTSRTVMARIDGLKKQWWSVAYCYKSDNPEEQVAPVAQYLSEPPDTSKIPDNLLCILHKPHTSFLGWAKIVRLKDLLRGLIAVKGWPTPDGACITEKARWLKGVPSELVLLQGWMASCSDSRKATRYRSKWRYYSLISQMPTQRTTLPALNVRFKAEGGEWTSTKVVRPQLRILECRMAKAWSFDRYESWMNRSHRDYIGFPMYDIINFLYAGKPGMALQALENSCE